MRFLIFLTFIGIIWCMPRDIEPTTQKITLNQGQPTNVILNNHGQGQQNQWSYFQTIKKEWQCLNGNCEEKTIKCKNSVCDSISNRFHAESYEPQLPALDPIPFPVDFSNLLNFPTLDFPKLPQFDNAGEVDLVLDNNNVQYYFSNAKFINSKCVNGVCEIKTKKCVNGKCEESVTTQRL